MGIVNFVKGALEAISGRHTSDSAKDIAKGIKKTLSKLPKVEGGDEFISKLGEHSEKLIDYRANYSEALKTGVGAGDAKKALDEVRKTAGTALKEAKSHIKDVKSLARGKFFGKVISSTPAKFVLGATAAVAAVSWLASRRNKQERAELVDSRNQQIDAMRADVAAMKGANTMMGLEPAPGDHAARVAAGRSGASAGVDVSNPAVSMPYDVVRT